MAVRMWLAFSALFVTWPVALAAGSGDRSTDAVELSRLLDSLRQAPDEPALQIRYLHRFPNSYEAFDKLFDAEDFGELYDGAEHIAMLSRLAPSHPAWVAAVLVEIAKDAKWKADAFNHLQSALSRHVIEHPATVAQMVGTLTEEERANFVAFLTDGTHSPAPNFSDVVSSLRASGAEALATALSSRDRAMRNRRRH